MDTWQKLDEKLGIVERTMMVHKTRLDGHDDKLKLHSTRLGGYADAELAYRRARDELQAIQEGNSAAYKQMLDAAKTQLTFSVTTALEKIKEPLSVVSEIRKAQEDRHSREALLAEQKAEQAKEESEREAKAKLKKADDDKTRADNRDFFIKAAVAGGAVATSLGTVISAYFAMRGH